MLDCGRRRRLRPALKRGSAETLPVCRLPARRGRTTHRRFRAGSWERLVCPPLVPGTSRALRQRGGASEGALAIRRHYRRPRPSAFNRIAPPVAMLLDETGPAAGIPARHRRSGTYQHVNLTIRPHSEQAETEPSAKVAKPCIVSRPFSRDERRAASQTSSHPAARSTPCKTSSRLKVSLSSLITTTGGSSPLNANRSQPPTSPLTTKPSPSRKPLTGR